MNNIIEITAVPVITAIIYGILTFYKLRIKRERYIRFIPLFAAVLGVILGLIAYFAVPCLMPAANVFTAILVGASSGLAATGANQIYKQLAKNFVKDAITDGGDETAMFRVANENEKNSDGKNTAVADNDEKNAKDNKNISRRNADNDDEQR